MQLASEKMTHWTTHLTWFFDEKKAGNIFLHGTGRDGYWRGLQGFADKRTSRCNQNTVAKALTLSPCLAVLSVSAQCAPITISLSAAKSHNAWVNAYHLWLRRKKETTRPAGGEGGGNSGCHTSCQNWRWKTGIDEVAERLSPLSGSHLF